MADGPVNSKVKIEKIVIGDNEFNISSRLYGYFAGVSSTTDKDYITSINLNGINFNLSSPLYVYKIPSDVNDDPDYELPPVLPDIPDIPTP